MTDRSSERRIALAIIGASVVLFLALFAIHGPSFQTPDEAKYVGLGLNLLDGSGLVTDLGEEILYHSPVWPLMLAVPKAWLGLDPFAVGHVMEALAAAVAIVFAAALAWRYRPAAGAVTAAALLGMPYLASQARSAGIDLPATAFVLAFLWVAPIAIQRDSVWLGLLAGLLFGIGFLMKETVIPFGPVPFLAALLSTVPARNVARAGAAALLTATLASSWWFVVFAQATGNVYRLGGPAWLLVPLVIVVAIAVAAGLSLPRLLETDAGRAVEARLARRSGRLRPLVAWGGLGLWLLGQLALYAFARKLGGAPIIRVAQLIGDVRTYFPQIGGTVAFGAVGLALALRAARSQPVWQLLFAGVVQLPLILLVLGIGETPRHYIATLFLACALGGVGFTAVARRAFAGADRWLLALAAAIVAVAGAAQLFHSVHVRVNAPRAALASLAVIAAVAVARWLWLRTEPRVRRAGARTIGALALVAVFVGGTGLATTTAVIKSRGDANVATRTHALDEIGDWVRANVEAGQTVAIGNALAYEMALELHGQVEVTRELPERAREDASSPTGIRLSTSGGLPPLILEGSLRVVDSLDAYEAANFVRRLKKAEAVVWLEAGYLEPTNSTTPLTEAFSNATGASLVMRWSYQYGARTLVVSAFRLDVSQLAFRPDTTYAEAQAVDVLAGMLKDGKAHAAAAAFLDRLILVPPGDIEAALARLRAVATP